MPLLRNYKVVHNRELISKLGWQLQQTHLRQLRKRGRRVCPIYQLISFSDHQKYGLHIKKGKIGTCIDMGPQNLRSFKHQNSQDFIEEEMQFWALHNYCFCFIFIFLLRSEPIHQHEQRIQQCQVLCRQEMDL